jgi:hypothetical protein
LRLTPLPRLALHRLLESPALGACLHDVGVEGEAVDDRLAEPGLGEDLGPLTKRAVKGASTGSLL